MTTATPPDGGATGYKKAIEGIRLRHNATVAALIARQSNHNETLRQAVNREHVAGLSSDGEGDDVGDINIESPTTHNHFGDDAFGVQAAIKKRQTRARRLATLAAAAALVGVGVSIPLALPFVLDAVDVPAAAEPAGDRVEYMLDLGD